MNIKQFYDEGLAHASYAIASEGLMAVIDPSRNPQPYYDYANEINAKIVAIFMTHPHADFVSSHLDIAKQTGAVIYNHPEFQAQYDTQPFGEGAQYNMGKVVFESIETPGHTPDSISVVLKDETGKVHSVFTGDALFVGDVGRPDLLETSGRANTSREQLARMLYHSLHDKLMVLPEDTLVYPAHGAGSLCGKALSEDRYSTIGREITTNYALQPMNEDEFVETLLADQPFIPKYFIHNVLMNKRGPEAIEKTLAKIPRLSADTPFAEDIIVIDARPEAVYKAAHPARAINIQNGGKFETWLGSVLAPDESFYVIASDANEAETLLQKAAKIGYEINIRGVYIGYNGPCIQSRSLDVTHFNTQPDAYTIVDTRNYTEKKAADIFPNAIHIPLPELRDRINEIPTDKPIVVHCAGGYRSAAGCSILRARLPEAIVYDLSERVKTYEPIVKA